MFFSKAGPMGALWGGCTPPCVSKNGGENMEESSSTANRTQKPFGSTLVSFPTKLSQTESSKIEGRRPKS